MLDDRAALGDRGGAAVQVAAAAGAIADAGLAVHVDDELRAVRAKIARRRPHDDRVRNLSLHEVVIRIRVLAVVRRRLLGRPNDGAALGAYGGCVRGALLAEFARRGNAFPGSLLLLVVTGPGIHDHLLDSDRDL